MPFNPEQAKVEYITEHRIKPTAWAVSDWGTGGVVIDMEAFAQLPTKRRLAILSQLQKFSKGA